MMCTACQARSLDPEEWASPPRCAFENGGEYNPDNWNCATVNMIREYIGDYNSNNQKRVDFRAYNAEADNGDQQYATIELPEIDELGNESIDYDTPLALWLTWYKRRGATGERMMETKPPTKTFPKLVMKEWPEPMTPDEWADVAERLRDGRMVVYSPKALSDFTRVGEETGVLQKEAPLTKQESKHDSERT